MLFSRWRGHGRGGLWGGGEGQGSVSGLPVHHWQQAFLEHMKRQKHITTGALGRAVYVGYDINTKVPWGDIPWYCSV